MCVNFTPPGKRDLPPRFKVKVPEELSWPEETWQDYDAPLIVAGAEARELMIASYGMVPKQHMPPGIRLTTMNARAETVAQKRSYAGAWKEGRLCLVPMQAFFEPNYESGVHVRWRIGMADESPFAVAGLWTSWTEAGGRTTHSFTQLTINADQHPLMKRFHKPGEEKRSLVILRPEEYDDWLHCRDPELARSFLREFPAQRMQAQPAPKAVKAKAKAETAEPAPPVQGGLDF